MPAAKYLQSFMRSERERNKRATVSHGRKFGGDLGEEVAGGFEFCQLGGEDLGRGERVGVGEALVFDPEEVEAELAALEDLGVGVAPPASVGVVFAPGGLALVRRAGLITGDKLVEVALGER